MAEIKEKFCSDCKHDGMMASEYPCNECCNAYLSKFEAKTNFDRIKEMSVDELAEFLTKMFNGKETLDSLSRLVFNEGISNDYVTEAIKKLLESEVQNNG